MKLRHGQRRARFSLEVLETRNLLSTVAPSTDGPALHYVLPNPVIVSNGVDAGSGATDTGGNAYQTR